MAKDKSKAASNIVLFAADAETETIANLVFDDLGGDGMAVRRGGVDVAIEYLSSNSSPRLVIVDISNSELPLSDVNALAEACEPGVEVVVIGKHNDIGLFRDLMQLGVSDYLAKPVTRDLLRRSIDTVRAGSQSINIRGRTGKLISVTGVRGGVGATTVASNLGWLLSERVGRRVAMIDLDFNYGGMSLALDQKATPGLREALENIHRVDQLFLERTLIHVNQRMALLSCEEPLDYEVKFEPRAYDELVGHLAKQFHYVVVDVPHGSGPNYKHALRNATVRIVVIDPTLAAVRHTIRLLKSIGAEEISKQTILVLNRRWAPGEGDLSVEEMEKALGRRIDVTVPYGKTATVIAENTGELVASKSSPVTEALSDLVHELSGRPRIKSSLLARLIKSAARSLQPTQITPALSDTTKDEPRLAPRAAMPLHDPETEETDKAPVKKKNGEPSFSDTFGDPYQSSKP